MLYKGYAVVHDQTKPIKKGCGIIEIHCIHRCRIGSFGSFLRYVDLSAILERSRLARENMQVSRRAAAFMDKKHHDIYFSTTFNELFLYSRVCDDVR